MAPFRAFRNWRHHADSRIIRFGAPCAEESSVRFSRRAVEALLFGVEATWSASRDQSFELCHSSGELGARFWIESLQSAGESLQAPLSSVSEHALALARGDATGGIMASLEDLFAAVRDNQADAVREIVSKEPELPAKRTETGTTAVLMATYCGADEALDVLLANKPELDGCEAAAVGDDDRLRQLAEADPQQVLGLGADGWTPLHLAGFMGRESTLRLLLELGAEVDRLSANDTGNTPLHAALAGQRSVAIVNALLAAGAPIDATGEGGITPLHVAAARGDIELIELLVAAGAHALALEDGKTPADLAEEHEHAEAAAMLRALTG